MHPANGRKALFVSEDFTTRIVGLPEEESDALLAKLFAHSFEDRFIYRHRWQPFDLVIWDNRSTLHLATGCPPHLRRTLYRTTVRGDVAGRRRVAAAMDFAALISTNSVE